MVKPPIPGQANVPTPPAGEIPKQIDIIKLQRTMIACFQDCLPEHIRFTLLIQMVANIILHTH